MNFDIISANSNILECSFKNGLISRAVKKDIIKLRIHNLRDYAEGKYKQIDDAPYGGGTGMILKPEPIFKAVNKLKTETEFDEVIFFSPQGLRFSQSMANEYSLKKNLILICGHYKGIDERIRENFVTKEISIGDYVLSGGELPAAILVDAIGRLLPGVLNDETSALTDSFQDNLLAPPVYTRPVDFRGWKVPDILMSGDHKKIEEWRHEQSLQRTKTRRPDLPESE